MNLSPEVESMNQSRTWTTSIPGSGNSKCKGAGLEHVQQVHGKARTVIVEERAGVEWWEVRTEC